MGLRIRGRNGGDRDDDWWRADRVLSRCQWSSVCCWQPPTVHGLEIAAFLEFHANDSGEVAGQAPDNVGRVRFAYRNHKPVTIRFTRAVSADAPTTVVDDHGDKRQLSMLPARANAVPYCESIVPDRVGIRCEPIGDHVFLALRFVWPPEFVRAGEQFELALRFPAVSAERRCPCCS